jgi:hypothetical protein
MKIHLIIPSKGGDQPIFTSEALIQEQFQNSLFSFAYKDYEKYQYHLWDGLINHVESTRNS